MLYLQTSGLKWLTQNETNKFDAIAIQEDKELGYIFENDIGARYSKMILDIPKI